MSERRFRVQPFHGHRKFIYEHGRWRIVFMGPRRTLLGGSLLGGVGGTGSRWSVGSVGLGFGVVTWVRRTKRAVSLRNAA